MLLNSYMPVESDYWQPRRELNVTLMPYWVKRLLERNQLDYIDLLNYDKLRAILSIEDMVQILCLNSCFEDSFLGQIFGSDRNLSYEWFETCSAKNKPEYQNVVQKLAMSDATKDTVFHRLSFDDGCQADVTFEVDDPLLKINGKDHSQDLFRIVPLQGRAVFIFLEKGILDTLEVRDARFKMVSEYLKALYTILPMREVSKYYGAFEHYINML